MPTAARHVRSVRLVTRVNDANEDRISLDPNIPQLHWPGHEDEQINDEFHGQSGGPVYRVIDANLERGEPVDRLEFVGIIFRQLIDSSWPVR
jgi:hypothetical protein